MYEQTSPYTATPSAQAISTTRLMGQVMFLVSVAHRRHGARDDRRP